tara:strand:- start:702 stop:1343 length:642 start_codon:yes stop_codon:yes gene_type:complete
MKYDQFGQMGSAYTDVAKPIIPPQGMVIVAIQFLEENTPTVLVPEKLDTEGPGFPQITGSTDVVASADPWMNFNGVTRSTCTGARTTVNATDDTITIQAANDKIAVGQYVLLVDTADTEAVGLDVDVDTPIPIYSGPNKRGVYVTKVNGVNITLSEVLSSGAPSSQDLIFLDSFHGAGGVQADSATYPACTIYGRWSTFTGENAKSVICYFGK